MKIKEIFEKYRKDFYKVDVIKAFYSMGIEIRNKDNTFRKLDDVILELKEVWERLEEKL